MKTFTSFSLASLVIVLLASANASDPSWQAIDHSHGTRFYLARPVRVQSTIALTGHAKSTPGKTAPEKRDSQRSNGTKPSPRTVPSPHGPVTYLPAE